MTQGVKMEVREVLDELKYVLKIKTDYELAEYFGISHSAISKWLSRNDLPPKWEIKIKKIKENESLNKIQINGNNNSQISINTSTFNHSNEIEKIISKLKYAPSQFLTNLLAKLEEFEKMSEI